MKSETKMTRTQLIDLIKSHSKYFTEDGTADDVATVRYNELIDAILALPIDVPGDEEIENKANGIANPKSQRYFERGEWLGVKEGARWMRDEILKRNRP